MNTNKKSSPKPGKSTKPAAAKSARAGKSSKPVTGKTQNSGKSTKSDGEKSVTARDKRKYIDFKIKVKKGDPLPNFNENEIRLNKYLSNAGVCSRREADVLIQTGVVTVNGVIITEMGHKIAPTDVVQYDGETINAEKSAMSYSINLKAL